MSKESKSLAALEFEFGAHDYSRRLGSRYVSIGISAGEVSRAVSVSKSYAAPLMSFRLSGFVIVSPSGSRLGNPNFCLQSPRGNVHARIYATMAAREGRKEAKGFRPLPGLAKIKFNFGNKFRRGGWVGLKSR